MIILYLFLLLASAAVGEEDRRVLDLTAATHDDFLTDALAKGRSVYVEYFAPWCPHCIQFAPTWNAVAGEVIDHSNDVVIAAVDCVAHADLCQQREIRGYPTIKIYECNNSTTVYKGSRDKSGLVADALARKNCRQGRIGSVWISDSLFNTITDYTPYQFQL